jgi:prepilin-type N-terminal cleavage/methylation domain-containing protein
VTLLITTRYSHSARRGFTAVEMTMVATVIAIIALIILPAFRSRLDESKLAAAYSEMDTLSKAILMAEADANIQPRLQDLDNPAVVDTTDSNPSLQAPIAQWNYALETAQVPTSRQRVSSLWKGPYTSFRRYTYLTQDLAIDNRIQPVFISNDSLSQGPILVTDFTGFGGNLEDTYTSGVPGREADRYPTDPWGNPYIFYGRGARNLDGPITVPPSAGGNNYAYPTSVIYSMGPDGLPGDGAALTAVNMHREGGFMGTGDDLEFRF